MARVNISLPEEIYKAARRNGLNISQVTRAALELELENIEKRKSLDAYLAELDAAFGPVTEEEQADADRWIDQVMGREPKQAPKQDKRTA